MARFGCYLAAIHQLVDCISQSDLELRALITTPLPTPPTSHNCPTHPTDWLVISLINMEN